MKPSNILGRAGRLRSLPLSRVGLADPAVPDGWPYLAYRCLSYRSTAQSSTSQYWTTGSSYRCRNPSFRTRALCGFATLALRPPPAPRDHRGGCRLSDARSRFAKILSISQTRMLPGLKMDPASGVAGWGHYANGRRGVIRRRRRPLSTLTHTKRAGTTWGGRGRAAREKGFTPAQPRPQTPSCGFRMASIASGCIATAHLDQARAVGPLSGE